jgi:TolB protein
MSSAISRRRLLGLGAAAVLGGCVRSGGSSEPSGQGPRAIAVAVDPRERRLTNLRQLTTSGSNAEAYFDWTGTRLIFQSTRPPYGCDQIFTMKTDGTNVRLVSTGRGRTTCGFFFPDGQRLIYASTHLAGDACPPPPDRSSGYVWPIYPGYEIVSANADGSNIRRLTDHDGYDAEGAVSPDGQRIVFTSLREGDLDLYLMNADGSGVTRLTDRLGYDGGAFFSWDGRSIVYRASHPDTPAEREEYLALLRQGLVRPRNLEVFVMRSDGTGVRRVTRAGGANFAPFMHPNGQQIIFSSNFDDATGRAFALYLINLDGSGLERVTWGESFASFPMFSRDGRHLVFSGTRNAAGRDINVFIADWVA